MGCHSYERRDVVCVAPRDKHPWVLLEQGSRKPAAAVGWLLELMDLAQSFLNQLLQMIQMRRG